MDASLRKLKNEVFRRKNIIAEVLKFIKDFIVKEGKETEHETHKYYTHVVYEFEDFAMFDMYYSSGETEFGGTSVRMMYKGISTVFDIHYSTNPEKEVEVIAFADEEKWLPAFRTAMKNKDKILEQKNVQRTKEEKAQHRKRQEEWAKSELLKEARRLGLIPEE